MTTTDMLDDRKTLGPWGGLRTRTRRPIDQVEGGGVDAQFATGESSARGTFHAVLRVGGVLLGLIMGGAIIWLLWYVVRLILFPA